MRRAVFVVPVLAACGSDHEVTQMCGHDAQGFDIEEVSVLEDGQGYPGMHDAVIMNFDTSTLPDGALWRVKSVDIMPIIGASDFDGFVDGERVTVEVFDGNNPKTAPLYASTKIFDLTDMDFQATTLDDPTTATERNQQFAWWSFDMTEAMPPGGMTTAGNYVVGVAWDGAGSPPMGYSNFDRPCDQNWTDYADGAGWVLNGATQGSQCSWPMLKVQPEVIQEQTSCDEGSVVVQ